MQGNAGRDFEDFRRNFQKSKEKETPKKHQDSDQNYAPIMRKSNSMLPSSAHKLAFNLESKSKNEQRKQPQKSLKPLTSNDKNPSPGERRRNKPSEDNLLNENEDSLLISQATQPRKASMRGNDSQPDDPSKNYKKGLIKEMIEMERGFTKKYSEHVDFMMKQVRGDISLQKQIEGGQFGGNFGAVVRKIRSMVSDKRRSIERLEAQVALFEEKWSQLKDKKRQHIKALNQKESRAQPTPDPVSEPQQQPQAPNNQFKANHQMRGVKLTPRSIKPISKHGDQQNNNGRFLMGGQELKIREMRTNRDNPARRNKHKANLSMGGGQYSERKHREQPGQGRKLLDYEHFRNMRMGVERPPAKDMQAQKLAEFKDRFKRDFAGNGNRNRKRAETKDLMDDDEDEEEDLI